MTRYAFGAEWGTAGCGSGFTSNVTSMTDHLVDADPAPSGDGRPGEGTADHGAAGDDAAIAAGGADAVVAGAAATSSRWGRWRERRRNRVSKWDRPPPPKDWRYFVGTLGKILIATGILMFGFVAYQLWGTGIETARAQSKLRNEFDRQVEAAVAVDEPDVGIDNWVVPPREPDEIEEPAPEPDAPADDAVDEEPVDDEAAEDGSADDEQAEEVPEPGEPAGDTLLGEPSPVVPGGVDLSNYAVDQNVRIIPNEAFARLEIPKIGTSHHIVPGVTVNDLKKGPGHYPDTPLPGQLGNASVAGHRTTYGAPFFNVDRLAPGDELVVTMITGDRFVYRVTGLQVVTAADSWVISTRDPSVAELTLTTCHPKYTARDRLVVHSVLVPEKSAQVGVAEFYDFDEPAAPPAPIPGDDPTFAADPADESDEPLAEAPLDAPTDGESPDPAAEDATDEPVPDEPAAGDAPDTATLDDEPAPEIDEPTADAEPEVATESSGDTAEEPTTDEVDDTDAAEDDAELDAFSQGWFDDRDAFPQIALWGSVLTLVSLIAYQISKKTRHDSIGFMVGILPFLIALYFFFQNVNRLLPPGL